MIAAGVASNQILFNGFCSYQMNIFEFSANKYNAPYSYGNQNM